MIQNCQVARLQKLISDLQGTADDKPAYRLWIDTLCCPVELSGKLISLERIADVYRNATHVLVLDSSLTSFTTTDKHPAELMLRIFATSAWMRRLWTLQGMLPVSIQIRHPAYLYLRGRSAEISALPVRRPGRLRLRFGDQGLRGWQARSTTHEILA
jgi:hypothetical protein